MARDMVSYGELTLRRSALTTVLKSIASIAFAVILGCVVFCSGFMEFSRKHEFISSHQIVCLMAGIAVVLVVAGLISRVSKHQAIVMRFKKPVVYNSIVSVMCVLVLCYQLLAIYMSWFRTDWDVATLVIPYSDQAKDWSDWYFSAYPNQRFLYSIFEILSVIGPYLGVTDRYLFLIISGSVMITLSIFLIGIASRWAFGYKIGYLTLFVNVLMVGTSPWFYVPYSDSYGIIWPSLLIFIYVVFLRRSRHTFIKWFLLSAIAYIGYSIKPTVIFIFLSICVIDFLGYRADAYNDKVANRRTAKEVIVDFLKVISAILLAVLISSSAISYVEKDMRPIDTDASFSMAHFLMMGANPEAGGVWNEGDVQFSKNCENQQERVSGNIEEWKRRVHDMGFTGMVDLMLRKTLTNFSDGTFTWSGEGKFWEQLPVEDSFFSMYYGIGSFDVDDPSMSTGLAFQVISQVMWLMILAGLALMMFSQGRNKVELVALFAVFALAVFLTVFECRARYLYLYLPIIIMLGVVGWSALFAKYRRIKLRIREERAVERATAAPAQSCGE